MSMLLITTGLGLASGVLINLLADDLPHGLRPRSIRCPTCGRPHRPAFWLGLSSLALRRGRCEQCGAPRQARHWVVEVASAAALAFLWSRSTSPAEFALAALVVEAFLLVAVIDLEHRLILHVVVLPVAVITAVVGVLNPRHTLLDTLLGGVIGYGVLLAFYGLGQLFSLGIARLRGRPVPEVALGGGDVNLAGAIGLLVGRQGILVALVIGVALGAAAALAYLVAQVLRRRYTAFESAMPYGPFLILGGLAVYLFRADIIAWVQR